MSKDFTSLLRAAGVEELLPKPSTDARIDDVDWLAVTKHPCPICDARRQTPCSWSIIAFETDWHAHPSRRALVDDVDWLMKRACVCGRNVEGAVLALERRGLARFGLLMKLRRRARGQRC
jgi:hypothetical protein